MAKGHDHKDLRCGLEVVPWKIVFELCGHGSPSVVKTHATGLSTKYYFITILLK